MIFTGIVSAATLTRGFLGYLTTFIEIPYTIGVLLVVGIMGGLALWGISESLWVAGFITLLEVGGLLVVIWLAGDSLALVPQHLDELTTPDNSSAWVGVFAGTFLAFYAFIGFEDMVNIVEEVKHPERNMPIAILLALAISALLYIVIALIAVLAMPLWQLSASKAPIYDLLYINHPEIAVWVAILSLMAIINGVLAQIIMGSRVLYGMSVQTRAPKMFSSVLEATRTPWLATICVSFLTAIFAIWIPLEQLAKMTSFIILCIFTLVNLALWRVRKLESEEFLLAAPRLPSFPFIGAALCIGLILIQAFSML